jgi:hypothetical protein
MLRINFRWIWYNQKKYKEGNENVDSQQSLSNWVSCLMRLTEYRLPLMDS